MTQSTKPTSTVNYAGLIRRFFALFYDSFLLLSLFFIVSAIFTSLNGGHAVEKNSPLYLLFLISLIGVSFLYFSYAWTHGGQTLGMQSWRMKLQTEEDKNISWKQASIRYLVAILSWLCLGSGFIWSLFNTKKQCWHDKASGSVMLDLR